MYRRTASLLEIAELVHCGAEGAKEGLSYTVAKDPFVSAAARALLNLSGTSSTRPAVRCSVKLSVCVDW
jgi:hypothetical protein